MATRLKAARDGPDWQRRLAEAVAGEVAFDPFTLGRYATDASSYQIMPAGSGDRQGTPRTCTQPSPSLARRAFP